MALAAANGGRGEPVNQVKLSGYLASDVNLHTLGHGVRTAITSLEFSRNSGPILLCAAESRVRQLAEFRKGDAIAITGRLIVNPKTRRPAVLIDVAGPWKMAVNRRVFQYEEDRADKSMKEVLEML